MKPNFFMITLAIVLLLHLGLFVYSVYSSLERVDSYVISATVLSSFPILSIAIINALVHHRKSHESYRYGVAICYFFVLLSNIFLCIFFIVFEALHSKRTVLIVLSISTFSFTFFQFLSFIFDVILKRFCETSITNVYCHAAGKICDKIFDLLFVIAIVSGLCYLIYEYLLYSFL